MKDTDKQSVTGVLGSQVISSLFILVGVVTLYDTNSYTDIDSKVFPRTAAIVLITCATLCLFSNWLKPIKEEGFGQGSWWRRCLLVSSMLFACFLMPFVGFLYACAIAFGGGLVAAMHLRWSPTRVVVYIVSGIALMLGFYALFSVALNVPLP